MKRKEMHYCQQVDGNVHKIFLYDDISKYGEWNWETWDYDESETSAAHFQKLLEAVPDGEEIELHINSYGGSVSEGTAIYNLLQESKAHKVGIVDGVCHSIAFTILQGCDEANHGVRYKRDYPQHVGQRHRKCKTAPGRGGQAGRVYGILCAADDAPCDHR